MLKDQAGAMVGLAQGYGIEEVWITEMGLGVEGQEVCSFAVLLWALWGEGGRVAFWVVVVVVMAFLRG